MLPQTGVTFSCDNAALQKLFDEAERKCLHNLKDFGADTVLVEGGGYEKIWLETQPMGGEMYWKRNMTAAMNNQLLFMRTQRADGRIAGSIQCHPDGTIEPQFNKFQGFCFPLHALNMWYLSGKETAYLDMLADCLEKFDQYLWRTRDSDGDGCLESFCVYDTGEDNALRYGHAPVYCTTDTPPEDADVVPMASMDVTSFSYACRDTLAEISLLRGDGRESEWREKADAVAANLKARLWDENRHACFDRDKHGKTAALHVLGFHQSEDGGCVCAPAPAESAGILDAAAPAERCSERPDVPQCAGEQLERAVRGPDVPARDYRLGALRV